MAAAQFDNDLRTLYESQLARRNCTSRPPQENTERQMLVDHLADLALLQASMSSMQQEISWRLCNDLSAKISVGEERVRTMITETNALKRMIDFEESHGFDNKVQRQDFDNEYVEVNLDVPSGRRVHVHLTVVP